MDSSWVNGGTILYVLIYLGSILLLFGLSVYFLITAVKFMKQKTEHDREIIEKLEEIIKLNQNSNSTSKNIWN